MTTKSDIFPYLAKLGERKFSMTRAIGWFFDWIIRWISFPFAILHLRWVQYKYKQISTSNDGNHTGSRIAKLRLLQSWEEYYMSQFDSWGKYHPRFSYSDGQYKRHQRFLDWLFPKKDFEEWELVIWCKEKAVTYYHNVIYKASKGDRNYAKEIMNQIDEWEREHRKNQL